MSWCDGTEGCFQMFLPSGGHGSEPTSRESWKELLTKAPDFWEFFPLLAVETTLGPISSPGVKPLNMDYMLVFPRFPSSTSHGLEFNRSADVLLIWFGEFVIWSLFLAWQNAHPCLALLSCPQDSNRIAKLTSSRFLLLGDISEVSFFFVLFFLWRCVTGILMWRRSAAGSIHQGNLVRISHVWLRALPQRSAWVGGAWAAAD